MPRTYLTGGVALGAVIIATSAHAQAAGGGEAATVDEIVVTAQKREQSLQDVPIVVTAVGARTLREAGVRDIKDLTVLTPGMTVTSTSSTTSTTARIRGVGTVGDNLGLESSVGVVIDGVYRPRNGVGFGDLGELERIEVLKGPQGTLFGKNATAGVINVVTKRPSFTFGAEGELTLSNLNGYGLSASVTGPIVEDQLAGRLFVARRERDGYVDVVTGDGPRDYDTDFDQNYFTARGQLLWTPISDLDVAFSIDYTHRDERCCASLQVVNGARTDLIAALFPGSVASPAAFEDYTAYLNRDTRKRIDDGGVSAEVNWDLGPAKLTSITAFRTYRSKGAADSDVSTADIIWSDIGWSGAQFEDFSQELRLAGGGESLDWLVGAFFSHQSLTSRTGTRYGEDFETYLSRLLTSGASSTYLAGLSGLSAGDAFATGQGQKDLYEQEEQSFAVFTNESWRITPKLELTAGLRYTWNTKGLDAHYDNTDGGAGCAAIAANASAPAAVVSAACQTFQNPYFTDLTTHQTNSEQALTGTLKAAYRFNPQVMAYVSYARGYKAGGFNLDRLAYSFSRTSSTSLQPITDTGFDPEFADSYELGVKSTLFDRRLLLNGTVFYQSFTDFQLNAYNGLTFTVTSVPEVVSRGVDADFVFLPMKGLSLQGGVTYAETQYSEDSASVLGADSALPGTRLSFAPLWSGSLAASYERPITAELVGRASLSAKYTSSYNTGSDLNPLKVQEALTLWNGRVAVGPQSERWSFEVWGQNLTDERYYQVAYDATYQSGSIAAFPAAPRTYGATLRIKY
ncbi:MAG: TonB-dependent receptor [Phenylobacterium sp.]|uniref:TonB-dependent receptor n=1 Tax=Phenylobacterium sp. TaxID=1871053 RepID=UPI00391B33B3